MCPTEPGTGALDPLELGLQILQTVVSRHIGAKT